VENIILNYLMRRYAGYKVVQPIDSEKFPNREREGLEGPFRLQSGLVVYYDPKEGLYYNSLTDMYLSHEDFRDYGGF